MNETTPDKPDNAAQAFEDLRAEVSVLRRAVEALPQSIVDNRPPDYSKDLAIIGEGLDAITRQLDHIQKYPFLNMTPQEHGQAIAQAGFNLLQDAERKLGDATRDTERERYNLKAMMGTARHKHDQKIWLIRTGLASAVGGLLVFMILARALPFGLDTFVAAAVLSENRWNAGIRLLNVSDPERWDRIVEGDRLWRPNQERIAACRATAAKSKKEESCTISVSP